MRLEAPALARECSEALLHMALGNRGDALGYRDFGGETEDMDCESDQINFMDELATDALTASQPEVLRRLSQWPALRTMDAVTADLLRHMGVDAEAALRLADVLGKERKELRIVDTEAENDELDRVVATENGWMVRVHPDDLVWNSAGLVLGPSLPDAVCASAAGRLLSEVLSHPALDRHPMTIDRIQSGPGGSTIAVDVGAIGHHKAGDLAKSHRAS